MDANIRKLERKIQTGDLSALPTYLAKVSRMGTNALKETLQQIILPNLSMEDLFLLRKEVFNTLNSRFNLKVLDIRQYHSDSHYLAKKNKDLQITDRKFKAIQLQLPILSSEQIRDFKGHTVEELFYIRLGMCDIDFSAYEEVVVMSSAVLMNQSYANYVTGILIESDESYNKRVKTAVARKTNKLKKQKEKEAKQQAEELKQLKKLLKKYPDAMEVSDG